MIILKVKHPVRFDPKPFKEKDWDNIKGEQQFSQFIGEHPSNPQKGEVDILVKKIEGDLEGIKELFFIGPDPFKGKLLYWTKGLLSGRKLTVYFHTVYMHGLEYMLRNLLQKGTLVVGLKKDELQKLSSLEGQRELLRVLARSILPSRAEQILNVAKPAMHLIPREEGQASASSFLGPPPDFFANNTSEGVNSLLHLATISREDLEKVYSSAKMESDLSFFLDIMNSEEGWPLSREKFRIIPSKRNGVNDSLSNGKEQVYVDTKVILEIPREDHSILHEWKLTESESSKYDGLYEIYHNLVLNKEVGETNKIGGYPNSVQGCVAYEAEQIFHSRKPGDDFYAEASKWQLMLQVSPYCKWFSFFDQFGDGSIYYMIRKIDLEEGNFDRAQLVVQNT